MSCKSRWGGRVHEGCAVPCASAVASRPTRRRCVGVLPEGKRNVFEELFIKRTPLSEARRGVITVLQKLGLEELLRQARAAPQTLTSAAPNPSPSP